MDRQHFLKLGRAYAFLARNIIGGKIVNVLLDLLAFMDYRMLIFLSMWHPDHDTRIRHLRKRGVQVGEHVFVDQGAWIEITTPRSVVLEDYGSVLRGGHSRPRRDGAKGGRRADAGKRDQAEVRFGSWDGLHNLARCHVRGDGTRCPGRL